MSPTNFHDHHAKPNNNNNNNNNNMVCPPTLKVNRESHMIKKSSSSSSSPPSSSSSSASNSLGIVGSSKPPPQRHPVIIYTHSPKIIHTHPKDFMALVQKLTGLSRSDNDDHQNPHQVKQEKGNKVHEEEKKNVKINVRGDDNDSSSVITEENCGGSIGDGQVHSCFVPPIFDPPNPYITNIPVFTPNSADFLCANQPFYNYTDSLFFTPPPSMRTSIPSSTTTSEVVNEFREY
ncbi:hypothetical protein Tsubulata_040204 [Turnera subulata]|uniref:VQ domain-containing protein n=1 Tax=Turnera subulata TaxID=218843 RepID=A0A9Q0F9B0_9ROSI|nr:hypothetical protein Tsubulata_040204 [Turnera subulata]